jgi:hypothetical protein
MKAAQCLPHRRPQPAPIGLRAALRLPDHLPPWNILNRLACSIVTAARLRYGTSPKFNGPLMTFRSLHCLVQMCRCPVQHGQKPVIAFTNGRRCSASGLGVSTPPRVARVGTAATQSAYHQQKTDDRPTYTGQLLYACTENPEIQIAHQQ